MISAKFLNNNCIIYECKTIFLYRKLYWFQGQQPKELREIWEESKILHADLKNSFTEWKEAACNENVRYWSLFLDELYPILRDLTHSIRQGDWHLFISVVRRCMPLFFGFGRTNYSRWGTLFLKIA